jgi:hypothetical protein
MELPQGLDSRHQAIRHLSALFGNQQGYVDLSYCRGDPRHDRVERYGWFGYNGNPEPLADMCLNLGAKHGDVYVGRSLYARKKRDPRSTLPSSVIFVDDAPVDGGYSMSIRTSANSRHGYFLLDAPLPSEDIVALQRNAAAALGADASGSDVTQLVRVPGTFNTKGGASFSVEMEFVDSCTYSLLELQARWPRVTRDAYIGAEVDWTMVEQWNGNIHGLLRAFDGVRVPRRVKPHAFLHKILTGAVDFSRDTSAARAAVVKGLVIHGYPDEEIFAMGPVIADLGASERKGSDWLYKDLARLIALYRSEHPNITVRPTSTVRTQPAKRLAKVERRARGRTVKLTPAQLLAFYQKEAVCEKVLLSIKEVAARFDVSEDTIKRLEKTLKAQGRVTREVSSDRMLSFICLLP